MESRLHLKAAMTDLLKHVILSAGKAGTAEGRKLKMNKNHKQGPLLAREGMSPADLVLVASGYRNVGIQ